MASDSANVKTVASFRTKAVPMPETGRDDATFEFASETTPAEVPPTRSVIKIRKKAMIAIGLTLGVLGAAGAVAAGLTLRTPTAPTGSLSVETDPPGAEVQIDGAARGTTPLTLTLPEGAHRLVVQRGSSSKQMNIDIPSGASKAYHIEWAEPSAPAGPSAQTGSLSVVSDPPGSAVSVDGTARGQTPLTIGGLSVGRHQVTVKGENGSYQRSVQVDAGATASLVVGAAPVTASASWGWLTLQSPFPLQVVEDGRLIGTSEIDRIMLPPGGHELDFVSEQFNFRQTVKVVVSAGRGAPVSLTIPRVAMNINALPWAAVFVDGTLIGDTPLANVEQPIGDHEIVFRHPQFGEKRQMARVTLKDSPRISVDMRSK